jgi:PAS domain S-box-containing protein
VRTDRLKESAERKRTEEALRESEEKYRQLFEVESDAIVLADRETGRFIDANPAALRLYGYSLREFLALKPGDVSAEPEKTRQAISEGRKFVALRWHRKKDGTIFPVEMTCSYFELQGRKAYVAAIRDITERKQTEDALRRSETKFRTLYDSTSDALLLSDEKGSLIECNPAGLAMFGCATAQELCSKHPADFSPPLQPDGTNSLTLANLRIATALEKGSHHFEWTHKRMDTGEAFPTEVHLTLMEVGGEQVILGSIRDITERKRAEEALGASREQLRALAARTRAVREEERTRIAREIHDVLAQELTSLKVDVTLLTYLLADSPGDSTRSLVREKLTAMAVTTATAIQSVQNIATDLRPMVLDSLGLCAAIEWMAKDFQAHTGIGCQVRLPRRDLPLDHDRSTALFRIMQESLTNIIRHAAATRVEIQLEGEPEHVTLTVRDNGRGIPESKIVAPGSVGLLGLRERALLLGGRCDISGRPGEGTRVQARIPLPPNSNSKSPPS